MAVAIQTTKRAAMIFNIVSAASIWFSTLLSKHEGSLKNDIEGIRLWFFWSLIGSTIVVFVGVIVEGIEHIVAATPGEDHKVSRHKKIERIGWTLVIMGVLGEGVFEALTTTADDLLQDFNATLLSITTDQARSAAHSATTAGADARQ